ncbi:Outer membrane protein (porin) [Roseateles sp. YR242]|uniref:porin n=1 Tax=Roseateles sp. YR242 TaxID=1855305 RepID=UPI0008BED1C2|nr:porin [Roseateles sp. YR242]SEK98311.1 Outer membrane protein (porin) [Roseateles sp. YR242]
MTHKTLSLTARAALGTPSALLVLALAGSPAFAQSSVSLYGLVDVSIGASRTAGTADSIKNVDSGKMTTSFIGFKGSEDLGGGLSAIFQLDSFLRADGGLNGRFTGDSFWARNAWVGLASKEWGSLKLGRNTTPLFVATLSFNPFGDSFGYSPSIRHVFSSNTVTGDSGWSDSALYTTPLIGGGFVGTAFVAAGEGSGGRNTGLGGGWSDGGPLAGSLVYQKVGKNNGTTAVDDTTAWLGSVSYDLSVVKLFGQYAKVDNTTRNIDYKLYEAGVAVPVGNGKVLAQYGQISPSAGGKRKTITVGYDHSLSKRTDAYVVAMSDKVEGITNGNGYSYSVGIRHRF